MWAGFAVTRNRPTTVYLFIQKKMLHPKVNLNLFSFSFIVGTFFWITIYAFIHLLAVCV